MGIMFTFGSGLLLLLGCLHGLWPIQGFETKVLEKEGKVDTDKTLNLVVFYIENIQLLAQYLRQENGESTVYGDLPKLKNIREMISRSISFQQAYGEMTTISSSASLLTGKPAVDTGIIQGKILPYIDFPSLASSGGLMSNDKTLADLLNHYGHLNAYFGNWKLGLGGGSHLPVKHGFDVWAGYVSTNIERCRKLTRISRSKRERLAHHPYVDFVVKTAPFWVTVVTVLCTLYYFHWLHLKGLANAVVYTICSSFILYLLLKVLQIQKLSACVLYKNTDIIEQPYNIENSTLFTTMKALKFLKFSEQATVPFYLHLSYTGLHPPYTTSVLFKHEPVHLSVAALMELDWSIGKVMDAIKEYGFYGNVMTVITGSSDCFEATQNMKSDSFQEGQQTATGYSRIGYEKFTEKSYNIQDSFESCLHIPLLLSFPGSENWTFNTESIVSVTDVFATIENIMSDGNAVRTGSLSGSSCSLVSKECNLDLTPVKSDLPNDFSAELNEDNKNASSNPEEESTVQSNKKQYHELCGAENRVLYHYADIIKPVAMTLPGPIRIVFANVTDGGKVLPYSEPIIFLLSQGTFGSNMSASYLENIYQNATRLMEQHLLQDRPNRWTSQYELPVYPWYFPCANFPRCELSRSPDDFSSIDL